MNKVSEHVWHMLDTLFDLVLASASPRFAILRHTSPRSLRQAEAAHRANEAKAEASVESSCQFCCIETSKRIQSAFETSPNLILRWKISRFLKCLVFFWNKVGTMYQCTPGNSRTPLNGDCRLVYSLQEAQEGEGSKGRLCAEPCLRAKRQWASVSLTASRGTTGIRSRKFCMTA